MQGSSRVCPGVTEPSCKNQRNIAKKVVDIDTPLCYDVLTCEKGLFLCAFFQLRAVSVVHRYLNFLLGGVIQGGNFKEVPLCALKSL